jgi:hypothetical protein
LAADDNRDDDPLFADYGPIADGPAFRRTGKARFMGAPLTLWIDLNRRTKSLTVGTLAVYIYRRTIVCGGRTVKLRLADLEALSVKRHSRRRALRQLADWGYIRIHKEPGQGVIIIWLWQGA